MDWRCVNYMYTVQDILDYLDGNFTISDDGFDSDIEGFESGNCDDLEPELSPQKPDNDEIDLRNIIIEDEEAEEADNSNVTAAGMPNNYSFFGNQVQTFNPAQVQEQWFSVTSGKTKWFVAKPPSLVKSITGSLIF